MVRLPMLAFGALALSAAASLPPPAITAIALRAHIAVLASDEFGGRGPGTGGGRKAEAYVIDSFGKAGLLPAAPGGGWREPVTIGAPGLLASLAGGHVQADNILGKVAGSRPETGAVLLTAHLDHLGTCRTFAIDRICNGAIDNASGVAMLIEIARAVAAGPRPARDVVFVATTGEEEGELGAKALAGNPPVPLARIVAALNFDTMAIAPAGAPVAIVGRRGTSLDRLIFATARAAGRRIDDSDWANRYLERQDGWPLLERGIPAVMFGGAFGDRARLQAFLAGRYHTPSDDLDHPILLDGEAEDANLTVTVVAALADPARWASSTAMR